MRLRAAFALIALVTPAFAQHGGGRGGSSRSRGVAGNAGFSGHSGFPQPGGFARPAPPVRYGAPSQAGFREAGPQRYSNPRTFAGENRFAPPRPPYRATAGSQSRDWDRDRDRDPDRNPDRNRDRDRDRDRFDARRRSFANWYVSTYPGWLGYPYLIDPGFYDWGDADDSTSDQGASPDFAAPYPDQGYGDPGQYPQQDYAGDASPWIAPNQQPRAGELTVASALEPEEPLTVIFKSGRAPLKVQNYMMTAKVLTDLDSRHYQQIPLDEIDLAATRRVNTTAGVEFQIPSASHD